jgi:NAD(P)-dependent dehydrogenase (short-subunit alcohol dehydrogenase family)
VTVPTPGGQQALIAIVAVGRRRNRTAGRTPRSPPTTSDAEAAAVQQTWRFGAIHINVNCAGTGAAMKTTSKAGPMPLEIFAKVIEINLIGTFNVLRLCAAQMTKNAPNADGERGVIVNTASVAAFDGQIGQAAYSASKGGVVSMTLPIARDLAPVGIRICTIAPGTFDTPMLAMLPDPQRQALAQILPAAPRQRRSSLRWRATSSSACLNGGETIRLDGASRASSGRGGVP